WTPHQLLEGCAIAAYAIGAERCYIYIRGEFTEPLKVMQQAIDEATSKGALGPNVFGSGKRINVIIHRGAGAYICGEETAMLNSIEGKRSSPRCAARSSASAAPRGQSRPPRRKPASSACRPPSTTWRPWRRSPTSSCG